METNFYPSRPDGIIPLQTAHAPPSFPVECLPPVIGNYVDFISKSVQVYPDMPATVIMCHCPIDRHCPPLSEKKK